MTDPMTFPDGFYAAIDQASGITTCWKRTTHPKKPSKKSFGPWKRGDHVGPHSGLTRADIPVDPAARQEFLTRVWAESAAWAEPIYAAIAADLDAARLLFAQFTGACSVCGRALTDPTSKLLGIGPDCRGSR